MTSNLGAQSLLEGIRDDGTIEENAQSEVMNELRMHFRPEFLNRLDEIIMFRPLTKDNINGIVDLIVDDLNKRLEEREISIRLSDAAKKLIADEAYDPSYGARPLKRYIQKYVETMSAKLILEDKVRPKDVITFDAEDGHLTAEAGKV